MKGSPRSSKTADLADSPQQQLNMYALAAGAAGVGLLALAQPSEAEIVYTSANVVISARILHSYALDLNQDGTTDFFLNATSRQSIDQSGGTSRIIARPAHSNGVVGYGGNAAALRAGQPIGIGRKFRGFLMASLFTFIGTEFQFRGRWANVVNRYLGLKFQIDGQTHYGWARLNVGGKTLTARLTGYAYETIPNKPIICGREKGADETRGVDGPNPAALDTPTPEPATLGLLAMGSPTLSVWRRKELLDEVPEHS